MIPTACLKPHFRRDRCRAQNRIVVCTAYTSPGAPPPISERRHQAAASMISTQIAISIALIIFMSRHMTVKVCPSIRNSVILQRKNDTQPLLPGPHSGKHPARKMLYALFICQMISDFIICLSPINVNMAERAPTVPAGRSHSRPTVSGPPPGRSVSCGWVLQSAGAYPGTAGLLPITGGSSLPPRGSI